MTTTEALRARAEAAESRATAAREENARLNAQVERLRTRLCIDPGGSDRIDELEQALQFAWHDIEEADAACSCPFEAEAKRLGAEVATLTERLSRSAHDSHVRQIRELQGEVDRLGGLLREARAVLDCGTPDENNDGWNAGHWCDRCGDSVDRNMELRKRIDAALGEG